MGSSVSCCKSSMVIDDQRSGSTHSSIKSSQRKQRKDSTTLAGGLTLKEYAVMTFSEECLSYFSQNVDLSKITIVSHLGQGSFAHVYLVRVRSTEEKSS